MTNPGVTYEQAVEVVEALKANAGNQVAAAKQLDLPRSTFRNRMKRAARMGLVPANGEILPGFEIKSISSQFDADGNVKGQSIKQVHEANGKFNLPDGHQLKGVSTLVDEAGNVQRQWFKTTNKPDPKKTAGLIAETIAGFDYKPIFISRPHIVEADLATVYPCADWHIGMMAWGRETGENWDLSIARETIMQGMGRVIDSSPIAHTGVVLGLGDLLHFDGHEPVTSRSKNILDVDGRYPKVLRTAADMIVETVSMALEKHERVLFRMLPGNHDDDASVALSLAMSMKFEGHDRVVVDDSPSPYWWWRWGKVHLGGTHGHRIKMRDLPLTMASDCPQDWAASVYRKIYTGHIHHESRIEEGGVVVESMRAPIAKDAYHAGARYRAGRSLYSETFDKSGGEVGRVSINI